MTEELVLHIPYAPAEQQEFSLAEPQWKFTGQAFEEMILGKSSTFTHVEHMDYATSLVHARNKGRQDNLLCPPTPAAHALYDAVLAAFTPPRNGAVLEFYSSIDRSFDKKHGIDCFFWFDSSIVTIDLTTWPLAYHLSKRADFVLTPDCFFKDPPTVLDPEAIRRTAKGIADLLQRKCRIDAARTLRKHLFKPRKRTVPTRWRPEV